MMLLRSRGCFARNAAALFHSTPSRLAAAAKPADGKKDAGKKKVAEVVEGKGLETCWPWKDKPCPKLSPDKDYPEWLWSVATPGKSLTLLTKQAKENLDGMTESEKRRFFKLRRKKNIKSHNAIEAVRFS